MSKPNRFTQAYRQAPWRIQTQRLIILLITAILGASILWVMVSVTVQAGAAGLEIQQMEGEQEDLQRQIASLNTQYAILTSADRMAKRAQEMGFEQIRPESIHYMVVPQYSGRKPANLAPSNAPAIHDRPVIRPGYTQSLWEWLLQGVLNMSEKDGAVSPQVGGSSP
jgi:cell division protein FtsB